MPAFKFRLMTPLLSVAAAAALPAYAQACTAAPQAKLRPVATESQIDYYDTVFIAERLSSQSVDPKSIHTNLGYEPVTFKVKKTIKGDNIPAVVTGWVSNGKLSICPRYTYFDGPLITVLAQAPDEKGNVGYVTLAGVSEPEFLGAQ